MGKNRQPQIAFCGSSNPTEQEREDARVIGTGLADAGAILLCGGLSGAMQAACQGAREAAGMTIGILPGYDHADANPFVDIVIATGAGHARNAILVASADAVIATGGGWGTLSEIALAVRMGKPVVLVGGWSSSLQHAAAGVESSRLTIAEGPAHAVSLAFASVDAAPRT